MSDQQPGRRHDMNDVMGILLECAELVVCDGLNHARADDPHRFATLPSEFDDGRARRRVVVDYEGGGKSRVSLHFVGTAGGEEKVVQVFSTLVQGPVDDARP